MTFSVMCEPAMSFLAMASQIRTHLAEQPMYVSASLLILLSTEGWMESRGLRDLELNWMADMA